MEASDNQQTSDVKLAELVAHSVHYDPENKLYQGKEHPFSVKGLMQKYGISENEAKALQTERLNHLESTFIPLIEQIETDEKTGLLTQTALGQRIIDDIQEMKRNPQGRWRYCVGVIDGNFMRELNKSNHVNGDRFIQAQARTLHDSLRDVDFIARGGGQSDEYILIFRVAESELGSKNHLIEHVKNIILPRIFQNWERDREIFFNDMGEEGGRLFKRGVGTFAVGLEEFKFEELEDIYNSWLREDDSTPLEFIHRLMVGADEAMKYAKIKAKRDPQIASDQVFHVHKYY